MVMSDLKPIHCSEQVFSFTFHGRKKLVSAGLIDGTVELWKYGSDRTNEMLWRKNNLFGLDNSGSARDVAFNPTSNELYAVSSSKSLVRVDVEQGEVIHSIANAHDAALNKILILNSEVSSDETPYMVATGDDEGVIKIWDSRTPEKATHHFNKQSDFIAGLSYNSDKNILLSASGDATLCAYDLRKAKRTVLSEDQESEPTSVVWMKNGTKAVVGTDDGVMLIFSNNRWIDCSDRFPGHKQSIDCMLKIDENQILTGSMDGKMRLVNLFPNKVVGAIEGKRGKAIESICQGVGDHERGVIAFSSVDPYIRFLDPACIDDLNDQGGGGDDSDGSDDDDNDDDDDNGADNDSDGDTAELDEELEELEKSLVAHDEDEEEEEEEEGKEEEEEEEEEKDRNDEDDEEDNSKPSKGKRPSQGKAKPAKRRPTQSFFSDLYD